MLQKTGLVFNIQRYSVHDGPGIRTIVFLKGCPLRCLWCANPEGLSFAAELSYSANLCRRCGRCTARCPQKALSHNPDGSIQINRSACSACGVCATACGAGALKVFGTSMTVEAALAEVEKDAPFYKRSGGGMTVSGGEPLAQASFLLPLLRGAKEKGLHVAMETSLYADADLVREVAPFVDYFLVDMKVCDTEQHRKLTGVSNVQIAQNIRLLAEELPSKADLVLRMPLIPTVNNTEEEIIAMADFITSLPREIPLEILPYHEFGRGKYQALDKEYLLGARGIPVQEMAAVASATERFRTLGVRVMTT